MRWRRRRGLLFEELSQGAAGRGVDALAVSYPDGAGTFAEDCIAATQRCRLADPQAGLKHELDESFASDETMRTLARSAQQAMHLLGGEIELVGARD